MDRTGQSNFPQNPYVWLALIAARITVAGQRATRLYGALVTAALLACAPLTAGAEVARTTIAFGQNPGVLTDFDFLPVAKQLPWTLIEDATAAGGVAIEQRGKPTAANHEQDQGGGIALRLTAPDSYYLVQLDALRDRVVFLRVLNGASEEVAAVDADVATNSWHILAVSAAGDQFVVSLDGVWAFTAFDKTLSRAGRIAADCNRQRHALRQHLDCTALAVNPAMVITANEP
jgi:hypothetical protein